MIVVSHWQGICLQYKTVAVIRYPRAIERESIEKREVFQRLSSISSTMISKNTEPQINKGRKLVCYVEELQAMSIMTSMRQRMMTQMLITQDTSTDNRVDLYYKSKTLQSTPWLSISTYWRGRASWLIGFYMQCDISCRLKLLVQILYY